MITHNEIRHIRDCLECISFADEIVVVDAFSTDGTWEWVKDCPGVKAVQRPFDDFTSQKSFALEQAAHHWVLFIDADERITPALQHEITETINTAHSCEAYYFYRRFIMKGKPLKYSGLQTDKVYRLFKKNAAYFDPGRIVHEDLILKGTSGILKNRLLHYFYSDYATYRQKMLRYGRLRGLEEYRKGIRPNGFHCYVKPLYKFLTHYIIRLGILDGKRGYIVSYINALGVYERYRELRRLRAGGQEGGRG